MQLFINILISSIFQILLINIIPFIWWFCSVKNKKIGYLEWLGIKKIKNENRKIVYRLLLIGIICFGILSIYILNMIKDVETATSQFNGLGFAGIIPALIYSFIQTAFTEEIFFRGFLLKRISHKFGFYIGNVIQSILFGLLHGIMFVNLATIFNTILIITFTSIIAYFMGYINEKKAGGSIILSWIIHGVSNIISSIISLFKFI